MLLSECVMAARDPSAASARTADVMRTDVRSELESGRCRHGDPNDGSGSIPAIRSETGSGEEVTLGSCVRKRPFADAYACFLEWVAALSLENAAPEELYVRLSPHCSGRGKSRTPMHHCRPPFACSAFSYLLLQQLPLRGTCLVRSIETQAENQAYHVPNLADTT